MLIKQKIRQSNEDAKIKIPLSLNNGFVGFQESIDDFIEDETGLSINAADDGEKILFVNTVQLQVYSFQFYNSTDDTFSPTLENAGFIQDDITNNEANFRTSFFVMQVLDSTSSENQTLLHSGYYNGYKFETITTGFVIDNTDDFQRIRISQNFINSNTGDTLTLYIRFYFYNAKLGRLQPFSNLAKDSDNTEDKLYFTITFNKTDKTYSYPPGFVIGKEIPNQDYANRVNSTVESFNNERPDTPTGNAFNNDGTYDTI